MLDAVVQGVQFLRGGGVHPITQDRGQAAIGFHNGSSAISVRNHPTSFARCKIGPAALRSPASDLPAGYRRPRKPLQGVEASDHPQHPEKPSTAVLAARSGRLSTDGGLGGREVVRPPAFWFALPDDFSTSRVISYARAHWEGLYVPPGGTY